MTTIYLRKTGSGFSPDTEDDQDAARRFKLGEVVKAEVVKPRNVRFFRKWWALLKVGFQLWEETCPKHVYKGQEILPEFGKFRRDVTIMAGFNKAVVNVNGELRLEPESIAFGNMTEERFAELYDATLNVLVRKVLRGSGVSEERLREMADAVMEFA